MAQQVINVGSAPNDGTGDKLRTGGGKINSNFTELYNLLVTTVYTNTVQTISGVKTFLTGMLKAPDITTTGDFTLYTGVEKTLFLQRPVYRDEYPAILVPATGAAAPDDAPHTVGGVLRNFKAFDGGNTEERLGGSFEIPHDYMTGQPIEVHVHWRPSASSTGTVKWYFDYEYSPPNAAPIAQVTMELSHIIASDKQYIHLLDTFGNMPVPATPFSLGGKIGFNIRRTPTGGDTYAGDALLEQIALHVPVDGMGSRQIYIK